MAIRRCAWMLLVLLLMTSVAGADTKMVRVSHTGSQIVLGREVPGRDQEVVTWFGEQRLRQAIRNISRFVQQKPLKKTRVSKRD